ncbi:MAG: hypothetical protein DRG20_01735 [Deltaproteobacteria bacterium]|nr:MAG: hypothetical protein DRG20_01735 [Deltaproteobacteria bacterium]
MKRKIIVIWLAIIVFFLGCATLATKEVKKPPKIIQSEYFVKTLDGISIYVVSKRPANQKPSHVVLLIPWVKSGSTLFNLPVEGYNVMDYFASKNFAVYAVDHRSYGKSTRTTGFDVRGLVCAEDMKTVADFIEEKEKVDKVDVVALSFGTVVAVSLAGKYPDEVRRIVLMGFPYKKVNTKSKPIVKKLISLADKGVAFIPSKPETAQGLWYKYDPKVLKKFTEIVNKRTPKIPTGPFVDLRDLDAVKFIPKIKQPTLLIYGDHEVFVDLTDALKCFKDLGAEKKGYLLVGNASHGLLLEKNHDIVYRTIYGWLSE